MDTPIKSGGLWTQTSAHGEMMDKMNECRTK